MRHRDNSCYNLGTTRFNVNTADLRIIVNFDTFRYFPAFFSKKLEAYLSHTC
jgi:hypothetical protein